jgi:hypothetical protein
LKGNLSEVKLQIQELLKKLPSGPSFKSIKTELEKVSDTLKNSTTYADDTAAAAGGVEIGQLYRNGSVVQIRIS